MLEEMNDNLPQADGNENNNPTATENADNQNIELISEAIESVNEPENANDSEVETSTEPLIEEVITASNEMKNEVSEAELTETTPFETSNYDVDLETDLILEPIDIKNYEKMSMPEIVDELSNLAKIDNILHTKDAVELLKTVFQSKYNHFIEEKKDEFIANLPENSTETIADFQYDYPLKNKFDHLYQIFREKKTKHFKGLENQLKQNLENRIQIVEELKNLINPGENIADSLKQFNDLRERWKNAGAIPKDKYNHVWGNYHHHLENFYDFLHKDRTARDFDFKHNLEQKQKIIARVEELINEEDVNKAFRELQDLHKIWKEEIGPVAKEHREEIWEKFSSLTKIMHDKRDALYEKLRAVEVANLDRKHKIIEQIEIIASEKMTSHNAWQVQADKIEALRTMFFETGKVPIEKNEETWSKFKNAVRNFNFEKNSFYKDIKKEQNDNLGLKLALIQKAKELKDSEDFASATPIMKQIQEDWKKIGHVPRKNSDAIWKEFKDACNHYFEKLKSQRSELNDIENEAFEKKNDFLENTLRNFEMSGNHKEDLDSIKNHIEKWKSFGRVPINKRNIDSKFNKVLDGLFEKLSLSKKDSEMMRFNNRIENMSDSNDNRKLDSEKQFIVKKIEEVQNEIFQLENNIQFFTNTKNAKKENSIVTEVRKNIATHKESLEVWKEKLKQLKKVQRENQEN